MQVGWAGGNGGNGGNVVYAHPITTICVSMNGDDSDRDLDGMD
jgi:hypothetical protein